MSHSSSNDPLRKRCYVVATNVDICTAMPLLTAATHIIVAASLDLTNTMVAAVAALGLRSSCERLGAMEECAAGPGAFRFVTFVHVGFEGCSPAVRNEC